MATERQLVRPSVQQWKLLSARSLALTTGKQLEIGLARPLGSRLEPVSELQSALA